MADTVEILLALRNVRQFVSGADKASGAVEHIGKSADKSGRQAKQGWKGVAKWAAPAAAFAGVASFMKTSVGATGDLAKSTMALQRSTGLDAKTASEWATVTKARGVNTKQFQVGLVKLSKTMEAARGGNDKAAQSLYKLGVNQDMIAKGDVGGAITRSADAFALMKNPAEKAATAQTLFGKSGLALLPMLSGGSKGLQEQLDLAAKYGATLDDKAVGGSKDLIAQQREMKIAMEGVKIQLGTALLPAILSVVGAFTGLVRIVQPILRNATVMKVLISALALAFLTYKIAVIASTISTLAFDAALLLIPLAVAAIVGGIILLYTKWGWFHNAVNNTFAWVKGHWPLLLAILTGPIGAAVILIIRNFDKIRDAAGRIWSFVSGLPGRIAGLAGRFASAGAGIARAIGRGISDVFRGGVSFAADIAGAVRKWLNDNTPFGDKIGFSVLGKSVKFTLPALAAGGFVRAGGAALVGERGPEVVSLPTGSAVYPTPAIDEAAAAAASSGSQTIVTRVYLDRRQIAEAVGSYVSDRKARK